MSEEGIAIIKVFALIAYLANTPCTPFISDGIYTEGWIIQPFYNIHLRSYNIFGLLLYYY